jgi:peptidoglycan hydrolase-like protein with peptidoglycan-binding domain
MGVGSADTVKDAIVPPQNDGGVPPKTVKAFNDAFNEVNRSTTSNNASGLQYSKGKDNYSKGKDNYSKGKDNSQPSQDTSKSHPIILARRPPIPAHRPPQNLTCTSPTAQQKAGAFVDPALRDVASGKMELAKNAKGPAVEKMQEALQRAGYKLPRFGADGQFGDESVEALKKFQTDHCLKDTGRLDKQTMEQLSIASTKGASTKGAGSNAGQQQVAAPANAGVAAPPKPAQPADVQGIVANAQAQKDPLAALRALNDGYAKAPQNVKDELLRDPGALKIIDGANAWANQPLQHAEDEMMPQGQTAAALRRLDQATQGLDKNLAGLVVDRALPGYEKFRADNADHLPGGSPFGPTGTGELVNLSGRIAGTRSGDDAVSRFAAMDGWNTDSVRNAIAGGADPAYAIAMAQQQGVNKNMVVQTIKDGIALRDGGKIANGGSVAATIDVASRMQAAGLDGSGVMKVATDGVQQFKDKVGADVKKLADHDAELAWLVQKDGAGLTPQRLNQAVADYRNQKGAGWQAEETQLRQQIADDGTKLLDQMTALNQLPPSLSGSGAAADRTLKTIANDPAAGLAISNAIESNPKLAEGKRAKDLADVFALSKVGDIGRKYTNELASAFLRRNVLDKMKGFDPKDPASVAQAKQAIRSLADEKFARMIGVTESETGKVVKELESAVDKVAAAKNEDEVISAVRDFDKKLGSDSALSKTFNKATLPGQLLRGVAVTFAGVSLINSYNKFNANPSDPQNGIKLVLDAGGFAQKNSELLVGLGKVSKDSAIGQFGGEWKLLGRASAGDLIAGVSAVLDGISAVRSAAGWGVPQDTGNAIFSGTTAVGGALTVAPAFGAAAWLGPVGLGVTAVGVVGKAIYEHVKDAHKYEGASRSFLKAAGYNDAAAAALSEQGGVASGGAGAAQMPFLAKYAAYKHMTPDQLMNWVNSLSPDQVEHLSGRLLQTAGDSNGDAGQFTDGPPQTTYISSGEGYGSDVTLANTVGVFDDYLNYDHVPHR